MASVLHFLQLVSELNQKKKQFIRLQFTGEAYLSFLIKKKIIWLHQVLVAARGLLLGHVGISLVVVLQRVQAQLQA